MMEIRGADESQSRIVNRSGGELADLIIEALQVPRYSVVPITRFDRRKADYDAPTAIPESRHQERAMSGRAKLSAQIDSQVRVGMRGCLGVIQLKYQFT